LRRSSALLAIGAFAAPPKVSQASVAFLDGPRGDKTCGNSGCSGAFVLLDFRGDQRALQLPHLAARRSPERETRI